jgi:hypothetical protein
MAEAVVSLVLATCPAFTKWSFTYPSSQSVCFLFYAMSVAGDSKTHLRLSTTSSSGERVTPCFLNHLRYSAREIE